MKKLLLITLILTGISTAQQKYLIYFKNKSISPKEKLLKISPEFSISEENLSARAIERRKKVMGEDSFITYEDIPIRENYVEEIERRGVKIVNRLNWFNAVSAYLAASQAAAIANLEFVRSVEKVKVFRNRPQINNNFKPGKFINTYKIVSHNYNYGASYTQYELSEIPQIHDLGILGDDVIIGVLDTGFDLTHPSLQNTSVIEQHDFIFNDDNTANEPGDDPTQESHGTYVLSIIGGYADGQLIGASFNSRFVVAKTEDMRSETHAEEDNYAAALEWMEQLGVDIVTSSLGYNIFDDGNSYTTADMDGKTALVTRASELAFQRGVTTITSAGNEGGYPSWRIITAPADGFNTIAVGSVNSSNQVASSSSRGPTADGRIKPEICAMGVGVYGASAGSGNYKYASGTSSASPIAAGAAALLLSAYPHLNNYQIRKIMMESGGNATLPDNDRGYGLISAKRAIEFPNLSESDGIYTINKIILDSSGVNSSSVKLIYSFAGDQREEEMNYDDSLIYSAALPSFEWNDSVSFYITYLDDNNTLKRIPETKNFSFAYGNMNISLNTQFEKNRKPVENYFLYQNYPNPFVPAVNDFTHIEFYSEYQTYYELNIYNAVGQKIINLASGTASKGLNYLFWNGKNNQGILCASGVYIVTLEIGGELKTSKLILMN